MKIISLTKIFPLAVFLYSSSALADSKKFADWILELPDQQHQKIKDPIRIPDNLEQYDLNKSIIACSFEDISQGYKTIAANIPAGHQIDATKDDLQKTGDGLIKIPCIDS